LEQNGHYPVKLSGNQNISYKQWTLVLL
jgi:hypothetical protein